MAGGALGIALAALVIGWNSGGLQNSWLGLGRTLTDWASGERTEPTGEAGRFLAVNLESAVDEMLASARQIPATPNQEIARELWPSNVQALQPLTVRFFASAQHPNGDGMLFVVHRRRGWEAGILICRQRDEQWKGPHLRENVVRAGPDGGFRRLSNDGHFWHWRRAPRP